jgi:GAF domain-containing protein
MNEPPELSDKKRLKAVQDSGLLGSPREAEFDQLTRLAARLLGAPAAFVTVISDDQQFIKSAETGDAPDPTGASQPLEASFCKFAVASKRPLIVEDAREHELVKENKAVAAGVIAYAGVPLKTHGGEAIGALCVVDSKPRKWSDDEIANLHVLARSAMKLVDERTQAGEPEEETGTRGGNDILQCVAEHLRALDDYSALLRGSAEVDLSEEARRREGVERTYRSLADRFRNVENEASLGNDDRTSRLLQAGRAYIAASAAREEAGRAFADGRVDLAGLEGSIRTQNDASDALRIAALHLGAII